MWTFAAILFLALASPAIAEYELQEELPEVLVRVPLPCPEGLQDHDRGDLVILVGANGLVEKTRFRETAPLNAANIDTAIRRWMFRPARLEGKAIAVWIAVPTLPRCARADSVGVVQQWIPSPDSTLAARLAAVDSIALDAVGTIRPAAGFGRELLAILQDPEAIAADLHDLPCIPESTVRLHLRSRSKSGTTTVAISYVCEYMQIESPEAVLQLPYRNVSDRVASLLTKHFPTGKPGSR